MNISKAASTLGKLGAGKRRNQDPVLRRAICDKARQANIKRLKSTFVERFWKRIKKGSPTDCWLWTGSVNTDGYGLIMRDKQRWNAHRMAYTLEVGPIPEGMCVLHRCDTPRCCNPSHLWIGTTQDNVIDRDKKGRGADRNGEKHPMSKLTAKDVVEIRKLASEGNPHKRIAAAFGIHFGYVSLIISKQRWKRV